MKPIRAGCRTVRHGERILEDLSGDLELFERIDTISAQKITEILRTLQINPLHVNCCIDSFGRLRGSRAHPQERPARPAPLSPRKPPAPAEATFDCRFRLRHAAITPCHGGTPRIPHPPAMPSISAATAKFCGDSCGVLGRLRAPDRPHQRRHGQGGRAAVDCRDGRRVDRQAAANPASARTPA